MKVFLLLALFFVGLNLPGQEITSDEHHNLKSHFKHYRIAMVLGHTYIPTHTIEGTQTVILPSIGLDIEYWFSKYWALGLHNDIELETYKVEQGEHETIIERNYPLVFTLDGMFKTPKGFILLIGAGIEIEEHENLSIIRAGLEYEFEFGHHWDVAPTLIYDSRINAFNTWTIGIGIGKRF